MKITRDCLHCNKNFTRRVVNREDFPKPKFCSIVCKGEWQSINLSGERNPNFNKSWTGEMKLKQKLLVESKVDDAYRKNCAKANKGKKFNQDRIQRMHKNRTRKSYSRIHDEETRRKIGLKSKEKFSDEYKKRVRKKYEDNGTWVPLDKKSEWEIYKKESDWVSQMFDLIDDLEELRLLSEMKVFHYKNNKNGVVRDHIYSRKDGFNNKVFPEILRHPANCKIISHVDNIKKGQKSDLTLKELFCRIREYKKPWSDQELTLTKIKEYENGNHWNR